MNKDEEFEKALEEKCDDFPCTKLGSTRADGFLMGADWAKSYFEKQLSHYRRQCLKYEKQLQTKDALISELEASIKEVYGCCKKPIDECAKCSNFVGDALEKIKQHRGENGK